MRLDRTTNGWLDKTVAEQTIDQAALLAIRTASITRSRIDSRVRHNPGDRRLVRQDCLGPDHRSGSFAGHEDSVSYQEPDRAAECDSTKAINGWLDKTVANQTIDQAAWMSACSIDPLGYLLRICRQRG